MLPFAIINNSFILTVTFKIKTVLSVFHNFFLRTQTKNKEEINNKDNSSLKKLKLFETITSISTEYTELTTSLYDPNVFYM